MHASWYVFFSKQSSASGDASIFFFFKLIYLLLSYKACYGVNELDIKKSEKLYIRVGVELWYTNMNQFQGSKII